MASCSLKIGRQNDSVEFSLGGNALVMVVARSEWESGSLKQLAQKWAALVGAEESREGLVW